MRGPGTPTIDQMQVLIAVADEGGLAAAARRLRRATSAVSYAIDNLEAQLGLKLFERVTTRRPRLTRGGQAVLADARAVLEQLDGLKARVRGLSEGLEAEVALAVDVMLPHDRLVDALAGFRAAFPTVALRLHAEALGGVTQLLRSGEAVLGWGNMPEFLVRDDLKARRLVLLKTGGLAGADYRFQAVWRRDTPPGPAGRWLVQRFTAQNRAQG